MDIQGYHCRKSLMSFFASQQKAAASFQEQCKILDVRSREIIQADFEDVQDEMRRDDTEFGQVRQIHDVLENISTGNRVTTKITFSRTSESSLTTFFFLCKYRNSSSNCIVHERMKVRQVPQKRTIATTSVPISGIYLLSVATKRA